MHDFAVWLGRTSLSGGLGQAVWIVPILQSIHILAIAMVLSTVAMIDLRIFGMVRTYSMAETTQRFMPFLWIGLVILAVTGLVLIVAEPKRTLDANPAFYLKMSLLAVAIMVTIAFQVSVRRNIAFWEDDSRQTMLLRVFGVCTLLLWFTIAIAGRWIAYAQTR
jgi:hypothetical protein